MNHDGPLGPALHNIYMRTNAARKWPKYSREFKKFKFAWTRERMYHFIYAPLGKSYLSSNL